MSSDPHAMLPHDANVARLINALDTLSRRVRTLENHDYGIQALNIVDVSGGLAIPFGGGWQDVTFNSQILVDPQFSHTSGTAVVTCNVASRLLISYDVSIYIGTCNVPAAYITQLLINRTGVYATVAGTYVWGSLPAVSVTEYLSMPMSGVIVDVDVGCLLKVQVAMGAGTGNNQSQTISNGTRLIITRLR